MRGAILGAMAEEDIDVIRRGWDAWLRGDLAALLREMAPDVVWDTSHFRDWPESTYQGVEGVERFLNEWLYVWDDYELRVDDVFVAPDGRVVSLIWHRGRGRNSGVELHLEMAQVATLREGKITRLDNYEDRAEALAAVGLGSRRP